MTAPTLHFWTRRDVDAAQGWDPDEAPRRYPSGYGHTFLELFVRMRAGGEPVSIGRRIPRGTRCVVVSLEELSEWHRHGLPHMTLSLSRQLIIERPALAVIRNDIHPHITAPYATTLELMPTSASVTDSLRQRFLPLLPQRGFRPRSPRRPVRISTVVLKAYRENVPAWTDKVARDLAACGVTLRVDDQNRDGSHGWEDFGDADAALCTQHPDSLGDPRRKPATKLINAWAAHVVPFCEPQVAYQEIAVAGADSIFFDDPADLPALVDELNDDQARLAALLAASHTRGQELTASRVVDMWRDALADAQPTTRSRILLDVSLAWVQIVLGVRWSSAIRRRMPSRAGGRTAHR